LNIKVLLPFEREKAEKMEKSEKEMVGMRSFIGGGIQWAQEESTGDTDRHTPLLLFLHLTSGLRLLRHPSPPPNKGNHPLD